MRNHLSSPIWLAISVLIILGLALLGPAERTLGTNVRLVYLHGAWVWSALIAFAAAAVVGLIGLVRRSKTTQRWSISIGRVGTLLWLTYLPLSMWTMQVNWNGLFLQEPRMRLAIDFALIALLLQTAIFVLDRPVEGSLLNIAFTISLGWSLIQTEQVMHPPSPIFSSDVASIKIYFVVLTGACLFAAWQLTRWIHRPAVDAP
jgi:hypothetical protein